jgi:hypothetical protein
MESPNAKNFTKKIAQYLEKIAGLKKIYPLTGYYEAWDLLPNETIDQEFFRVFKASKYTILVIDEPFVRKTWPSYLGGTMMRLLGKGEKQNKEMNRYFVHNDDKFTLLCIF